MFVLFILLRPYDFSMNNSPSQHLLADAEGLVVEVLDELSGHVVRVVRVAVHALLLQEVNFQHHGAYTLFGPVKLVVCYYKEGEKRRKW